LVHDAEALMVSLLLTPGILTVSVATPVMKVKGLLSTTVMPLIVTVSWELVTDGTGNNW
jgi:hypothetical protein